MAAKLPPLGDRPRGSRVWCGSLPIGDTRPVSYTHLHRIFDILGALFPVGLVLVLALDIGDLVQIAHHDAAGVQLAGRVVYRLDGDDLSLVVMGFLGGGDRCV